MGSLSRPTTATEERRRTERAMVSLFRVAGGLGFLGVGFWLSEL